MINTKQAISKLKTLKVLSPDGERNPGIKDTVFITGHGPINFRLLEKILKTLNQTKVSEFYIQDSIGPGASIGFFGLTLLGVNRQSGPLKPAPYQTIGNT